MCQCKDAAQKGKDGPQKEAHNLEVFDLLTQTIQFRCGTTQRQLCKASNGPPVEELQHGLNIPEVSRAAWHQGNAHGHVSAYR